MDRRRVLLAVTGGIAAYKTPELVRRLRGDGHDVRCVLSAAAREFVSPLVLQTLSQHEVRSALFDVDAEGRIGHIDLADAADLVIVAPATAHAIAKLAGGLADDLASTLLLATRAPVLMAPAMNVNMWEHAATRENVARLAARGVHFVGPEPGWLACGYEGTGRMAEPDSIAAAATALLGPRSLSGARVLVTAGGTREPIDPVRAITNRSSGKMGYALAAEAARRGADVVLVSAPTALPAPYGVRRVDVETALEMRDAVRAEWPGVEIAVMCAAVADFRPARPADRKIKKEALGAEAPLALELVENPDILAELCRERGQRVVVGFAAESEDVLEAARRKLARKGCDLLVANDVSRADAGFDSDRNAVWLLDARGAVEELPLLAKAEVAARVFDRVEKLRGEGRP
jgi:phosphopantothenoylcysteine decarboxylase / phosphopantothenate---cysteine ligase